MSDSETRPCGKCETAFPADYSFFYVDNHAEKGRDRYCEACALLEWPVPVYFRTHPGVPDWCVARLKSYQVLRRLQQWFGRYSPQRIKTFSVHVFHRRETERLEWMGLWDSNRSSGAPTEPYSYRGWCNSGTEIVLLVDETETADSMEWLLYHELGHLACSRAPMIDAAMHEENRNDGRTHYEWKDDAGHEADSEERLVNRVATAYMGGKEYARPWWRPRVNAKLAGRTEFPDPHAPPPPPPPEPDVERVVDDALLASALRDIALPPSGVAT